METMYVIDKEIGYKGHVLSTMHNGYVDYSGSLYNENGPNLTFDEYKKLKKNDNLIVLTWEELEPFVMNYEKSLQGAWTEITEERWDDMLNVLPPGGWRNLNSRWNIVYCIEAYTSSLHTHFVKDRTTGKCYEALRSKFTKNEEFITQLNELL